MADQWTWQQGSPSDGGIASYGQPSGFMVNPATGQKLPYDAYTALMKTQAEQQRVAGLAAQGLNPDGSPMKPAYNSQLNADGTMKDVYTYKPATLDASTLDSYKQFKDQATATGLSPWATMQKQLLDKQTQDQKQTAGAQSMQAGAQARSGLAMRGGLSDATRERLATSGQRDLMSTNQNINRTSSTNLLNLGAQDAQMKQQMLGTLLNTDVGIDEYNIGNTNTGSQYNIKNELQQQDAANSWNMDTYKEQMDKWAANKQADATAASGGGGGK